MEPTNLTPPAGNNPLKHLRASDIRGIAQLATQATRGVTRMTEELHQTVLGTMGIRGEKSNGQTRGITGLVYRSVHAITRLVGKSTDTVLATLQPLMKSLGAEKSETAQRSTVLAALNGVMGDQLLASNNPLATGMSLRYRDRVLHWRTQVPIPEPEGKVLLLIHGLCMTDLRRHARQKAHFSDHGESLASALAYSPVYLDYNSGLHISQNGRELSSQLEQLLTHWPTPIEELSVVAHSMGGLLIRSAFHCAQTDGLHWPALVKNIVFMGTPHHGAPLERVGNWVDTILGSTPFTRPFSALGQIRSAGITDLRYGHIRDDDWQDQNRFHLTTDKRRSMPLPGDVDCYTVAASLSDRQGTLANRLIGDGMVPLHSALGVHNDVQHHLIFKQKSQLIAYRTNHMELLNSPEVSQQLMQWLRPG